MTKTAQDTKPNMPIRRGTPESCSFCTKTFGPKHVVSKKNMHFVFRVRTKFATFYGPTHSGCVDRLTDLQLPEDWSM